MSPAREHHIQVTRTARYLTLGEQGPGLEQVWFVLHGFSQLARDFIREFESLEDGRHLVVAPEALNRFYLDPSGGRSPDARVGATWMTREDRLAEIADYVAYLDALYAQVFEQVEREQVTVTVLGFSQGTATAARWLCRGRSRADRLVLWAGVLPPELERQSVAPLRGIRLIVVAGNRDRFVTPEAESSEDERMASLQLEFERLRFDGGHRLDAQLLRELAASGRR